MKAIKLFIFFIFVCGSFALSGCGAVSSAVDNVTGLVGLNETATVIAKVAQIRSSYAVVAADLLEIKRGATLEVLDEIDFEKVRWYRVRANDEDRTEGWVEAQNVILSDLLEKSRKIAEEEKDYQAQATAQIRAATNLRLTPEQRDDNILVKLDSLSTFEIVSWRFVPKAQDASDVDNVAKNDEKPTGRRTRNAEIEAAKEANEPEKMDEKYDVWYKVRLDRSVSPAPAGWVFGRQVELQVPGDIAFYQQNNKKYVTWQRLDNIEAIDKNASRDGVKVSKPGSWVILSRTNIVKAQDGIEPDFDGIIVIAYDKYNEEHYTAYRSSEVWGLLPLKVEGTADNKTIVLKLRGANGQMEEKRFVTFKDAKGHLKVTPPEGLAASLNKMNEDIDLDNPFSEPFELEITDTIDLHAFAPRDIKSVVETYLAEARKKDFRVVRIIHGKGIGVQRETVRKILSETDFVKSFKSAPEFSGSWGATVVEFK